MVMRSTRICWRTALSSRFKHLLVPFLFACSTGCTEYDPPPSATLQQPEGGAFAEGDSVILLFSEPVDADTLKIRIWPNHRDIENEIVEGTEPLVAECGADDECGELVTDLVSGKQELRMSLGEELGKPGQPLIVELLPGLKDPEGNDTAASSFWDIQFRSGAGLNTEPVEFDNGIYILLAQVEKPLPAVLTLMSDLRVLPDGRFVLAGAEGDEINGAPRNTQDPENLVVDETNQGFTVYATGFVTLDDDGKRLLETDAFDLTLPIGPLEVSMRDVRVFAEIVKNNDTGKDRLEGTLSFSEITLINGDNENTQPGGSTALVADYVEPELAPEGLPDVCGDLCGLVELGLCAPPEDFPDPDFCAE